MSYHNHILRAKQGVAPLGDFVYSVTVAASETVSLPMYNLDDSLYNFTVNFGDLTGDKSVSAYADPDRQHTYVGAGTYDITITGLFDKITFTDSPTSIVELKKWGVAKLSGGSFYNCSNLITISATDVPLINGITLINSFRNCPVTTVNSAFLNINTGLVTSFHQMFYNSSFNEDISGWNISNVTTMNSMFDLGALSTVNYDLLLVGWEAQVEQPNVIFSAGAAKYSAGAAAARAALVANGWTITDGGPV